MTLWRMHDSRPGPMVPVAASEARAWNERGFGIFVAVNSFNGPRRVERLRRIRGWAVDIDGDEKAVQLERVRRSPLPPSRLVETKAGHHVWFLAADGATAATWDAILSRLVEFFGADRRAMDLCRVLRAPGYLHVKDPRAPFLVRLVGSCERRYREAKMLESFPDVGGAERQAKAEQRAQWARSPAQGEGFWDRVMALDAAAGLERLSGHPAVGGERFSFRRTRSGLNILVDGKGTSCWIDASGRIGSADHGGPALGQWLAWYGWSWPEVRRILVEVFPELIEVRR